MKVRLISKPEKTGEANRFNTHALAEIFMYFDDGDADSVFVDSLEVFIKATNQWKALTQAFKDHDVITDNYNTCFFEPENDEERKRGYSL